MKIGNMQNFPQQETPSAFLTSYRDTPHVSTGVPPVICFFGTVIETSSSTNRLQTTKLEKLDKQIVT